MQSGNRVILWTFKAWFGALRRAVDINLDDLPFIINACFVLINFCEANREIIADQTVAAALQYDRDFQPSTQQHHFQTMKLREDESEMCLPSFLTPEWFSYVVWRLLKISPPIVVCHCHVIRLNEWDKIHFTLHSQSKFNLTQAQSNKLNVMYC